MVAIYFQQVLASPVLAYEEGLDFFEGKGMLNETLRKQVDDLKAHGIDYVVIGAMALNQHEYHRFTSELVIAITNDQKLINKLVASPHVCQLKIVPIPTKKIAWDQTHEGNLFEHLYALRAFQRAAAAA